MPQLKYQFRSVHPFVTEVFAHLWHAVAWSELGGDSAPWCESSGCIFEMSPGWSASLRSGRTDVACVFAISSHTSNCLAAELKRFSGPRFGSARSVWHGRTKISNRCLPATFLEEEWNSDTGEGILIWLYIGAWNWVTHWKLCTIPDWGWYPRPDAENLGTDLLLDSALLAAGLLENHVPKVLCLWKKTFAMIKPLLQSICFTFDLAPEDSVTFWTQRGQPLDRERPRDILRPPCGLISNSWIALQSVSLLRVSCVLLLRPGHWRVLGVKPPWRMWGDQSVSPRGVVKRRTNRFSNWGHHIENQWWCLLRCDRVQLSICSTKPARSLRKPRVTKVSSNIWLSRDLIISSKLLPQFFLSNGWDKPGWQRKPDFLCHS